MSITLDGSSGITAPTYGGTVASEYSVPVTAFKNRILNGQMQIDQRNAGASVTASNASSTTYTLDRWYYYAVQASKFTIQQNAGSVTPPTGFSNYLGITSSSAYSVLTGDLFEIAQAIEGFNTADLAWGTANAQSVTVSFWVRSSLTGTFGGSLCNGGFNRSYPFNYTINSANTWEQKSITISGDTTGTWATNNTGGIHLRFGLGSGATFSGTASAWSAGNYVQPTGSVSVVGTNGATFYITGVQLEKGSTATSFDYRPYGTELALCQRYYAKYNSGTTPYCAFGNGYSITTSVGNIFFKYPVSMRTTPTSVLSNTAIAFGAGLSVAATLVNEYLGIDSGQIGISFSGGPSAGSFIMLQGNNNTAAFVSLSAEL